MSQNESLQAARAGYRCWVVGDIHHFLITGAETQDAYSVTEIYVTPGNGTPPHTHTREDEGFCILEGELEINVDGRPVTVRPGEFFHAPRNVPHFFTNKGNVPVRMLVTAVPAGLERFFAEVGEVAAEECSVAPAPNLERILSVAPRYGLAIHLPGA